MRFIIPARLRADSFDPLNIVARLGLLIGESIIDIALWRRYGVERSAVIRGQGDVFLDSCRKIGLITGVSSELSRASADSRLK